MKKRQPVALLSAGKLADSPVTRFWALADHLGPVKAPSLRLASRAVNTLRAGYAVENCDDFQHCTLILISVPDETVPATIEELCASRLRWHNKAVVLCSAWLDGTALQPLAIQGASVGSVAPMPGFEDRQYLVEGNSLVVREVQSLVGRRGTRILTIDPPLKPFFLAAANCTGALLYSLLTATAECIRQTGIPSSDAEAIIQKQVEKTLRSYFVAGRNADPELKGLAKQLQSLAVVQPAVAEYLQGMAKLSADLMSRTGRAAAARGSSTS
jgi:hypothetical protein